MTAREVGERLRSMAEGRVAFDQALGVLTTYRVGGPASVLFEPASPEDLTLLTTASREAGVDPATLDVVVIGRGSNVVISDQGFDGVVIRMTQPMSWIRSDDPERVAAGAATSLPLLANWAARRSLAGLEFTVGIPGSVGGGVRMNAGAHEGSISDTLVEVQIFDLHAGVLEQRPAEALGLSYRHSDLGPSEVVVAATFGLRPDDQEAIKERMDRYRKHRADTQPGALQNAGSTFKNPPGDSAGRLVEAAGLKGHRVGGAAVSELHANFFLASDSASAQDVFDLVHDVRARVMERFGIALEPEVRFIGPFADSVDRAGAPR
ncbi:MAG: UDP-N-acetylmuramate dehydrogenase [Actinomycetota bacterium]